MKKKYSTKPGRRVVPRLRDEGGFFNLRALLGLTLCLFGVALAILAERGAALRPAPEPDRYMPVPGNSSQSEAAGLEQLEQYWHDRLTFPTGRFDPAWVRAAAAQHARMTSGVPAGQHLKLDLANPNALSTTNFTALGPQPMRMTGCSGCFDYTKTEGRVNDIAVDPTTTTNGSIVAYSGAVGGGVWKTTNCCSASTTWTVVTDDPLISTTAIDTVTIDPNNHNTIYAGTGDLNFGSFSMGSQGILKSTDAGATWTVLGENVFGMIYSEPPGQFPQYNAVGKVRVDPNNSSKVVAGTKQGLFFSYDGGANWTGPCFTNAFSTQRQDVTGLELSNMSGTTRIIAAIGTRGFPTSVQYDLGKNGANGLYTATMGSSGCPSFSSIASNANGFVFGNQVTGSPYTTGAPMNAGNGTPCDYPISGGNGTCVSTTNQLGRIDIAVAPSNANYIYAQACSIVFNNNSGCGNTNGCQLGAWASTDGGGSWSYMEGSQGGSLRNCNNGQGDYPQNWYDQGIDVDPNNPDRVFFDTFEVWFATRTGTVWNDTSCGYSGASPHPVHVDQHALAFVPGSSSILAAGNDGGLHGTANADVVNQTTDPTWFNMDTNINTIEFYSGDISGNFANAASPQASGGSQDNASGSVTFAGTPIGPVQWQVGIGGDGFYSRIDPVGTGTNLRFFQGNNSGGMSRCVNNCTVGGATWSNVAGSWFGDTRSFVMPYDLFHGGVPGGDDCPPAGVPGGCGHLIAATTRVFETIHGGNASMGSADWYITNTPTTQNMTKQTLGNRSYINQVKYSPKYSSVAMLGTNDANVWIGFNLGTGTASQANWVNVTGANTVLPLRPVQGIALDPTVTAANLPVGYAAVGGFNENTPGSPGNVFQITCAADCGSFTWVNKTGNLPDIPVDSIIVNPNMPQQVFAGTDWGVYYTDDITVGSPTWLRFENGIPHAMVWDMQIDRGSTTLSVWTRSRGAYAFPLPGGAPSPTPTASPSGTPSATPTATATATPTATATATATPTGTPSATPTATCQVTYTTATATGTITAGGTDIGNHCDDCNTLVNLPFPVSVYGNPPISVAYAGSNGTLQFVAVPNPKPFYFQQCVPVNPSQGGPFLNALFPYYDDLRTDETEICPDCGIFTQTLGTAPNRQFVIRWKTTYFNFAGTAEYEALLTEGSNTLSVIYGANENDGATAASGIQQDLKVFTSFSCNEAVLTPGLRVNYIPTGCGSPTPTPTATATATATATPTATSTPGARHTPTPRPRPTPPPRP
jgi:hypothetical protein